jgi:Flp pilus assembly protein CpaB
MTSTPSNPIIIPPMWQDLAVTLLRTGLIAGGVVGANKAQDTATQVVGAIVVLASIGWSIYSRYVVNKNGKKMADLLPDEIAIAKDKT